MSTCWRTIPQVNENRSWCHHQPQLLWNACLYRETGNDLWSDNDRLSCSRGRNWQRSLIAFTWEYRDHSAFTLQTVVQTKAILLLAILYFLLLPFSLPTSLVPSIIRVSPVYSFLIFHPLFLLGCCFPLFHYSFIPSPLRFLSFLVIVFIPFYHALSSALFVFIFLSYVVK